jgi:ornithine carbamoyltransferase
MGLNLRNRSLLTVQDYTQREFQYLLDLARDLKRAKYARTEQEHLKGKEIVLIFEKTSTRTRCAFEVACHDQGAHVTYLDPRLADRPQGVGQGHRPVLGRMFDAIEFRGFSQEAGRISPNMPACRSTTVLPTSITRRRCWPMS